MLANLLDFRRAAARILAPAIVLGLSAVIGIHVHASNNSNSPTGSLYETTEKNYVLDNGSSKPSFSYGKKSIGSLTLTGASVSHQKEKYQNWDTYLAEDKVYFNFKYNGGFQSEVEEDWRLVSDNYKSVGEVSLNDKIKKGVIIIEKSSDGENGWEVVSETENFFADNPNGKDGLYSAPTHDLKKGAYYRVTIAYKMTRVVDKKQVIPNWVPFVDKDFAAKSEEENISCVEQYKFFLYYGGNPIVLQDIASRNEIDSAIVQNGFVISKDGWNEEVKVSENGREPVTVDDYASFYQAGTYQIETTSKMGEHFTTDVQIADGLKMIDVTREVYVASAKSDYDKGEIEEKSTPASIKAYTTLRIGQTGSDDIYKSTENDGTPVYGIGGSGVSLYLNLTGAQQLIDNGWTIVSDDWGEKTKQTIKGARTGEVSTGVLIVQTSKTGKDGEWQNVDRDKYANGLTTTNYNDIWAGKNDVCIYSPSGNDVKDGIYIRVIYAYKAQKVDDKKSAYRSYEMYTFRLSNSNLGAVTFHNQTVKNDLHKLYANEDDATAEEYYQAETLISGSETVTGFRIDTSNTTIKDYSISYNGENIEPSSNHIYTETGKYVIGLKGLAGNKRTVVIYVDSRSNKEALASYFGDSFITKGKRVYDETSSYPVYEGTVSYHISKMTDEYLPVSGQITSDTGVSINVLATPEEKTGTLTEPGTYTCTFRTNATGNGTTKAGDSRVFTFRFKIIADGTAPGPQVNKKALHEYSKSYISDAYPIYYGMTDKSALSGRITLAFASEEAAIEYAYKYEKGTVEKQADGTYRYTGASDSQQKGSYDSAWDLTDDINTYAQDKIHKSYFDMSEEFTYRTLDETTLQNTSNLRALELKNSIIAFADENAKNQLLSHDQLPLLSSKPYSYIENPAKDDEAVVSDMYADFKFIKDKYGIDSSKVTIVDKNGKEINIAYKKEVGQQLLDAGCATGIVTIKESNKYGDTTEYNAAFINPDDNTATISIDYYSGGKEGSRSFTQKEDGEGISVQAFKISSVVDELSPYDLILVSKDGKVVDFMAADQVGTNTWTEQGDYVIKIVNRLGYSFSVNLSIEKETYKNSPFTDEDSDNAPKQDDSVVSSVDDNTVDEHTDDAVLNEQDASSERHSGGSQWLLVVVLIIAACGLYAWKKYKGSHYQKLRSNKEIEDIDYYMLDDIDSEDVTEDEDPGEEDSEQQDSDQ